VVARDPRRACSRPRVDAPGAGHLHRVGVGRGAAQEHDKCRSCKPEDRNDDQEHVIPVFEVIASAEARRNLIFLSV
jgi:hypothetical protein